MQAAAAAGKAAPSRSARAAGLRKGAGGRGTAGKRAGNDVNVALVGVDGGGGGGGGKGGGARKRKAAEGSGMVSRRLQGCLRRKQVARPMYV